MKPYRRPSAPAAFTLIELLVVLGIVALLLTLSVPRYFKSVDQAKEAVLAENLLVTRDTIDKFFGDTGRYPESLDELVVRKYLRALPHDPITDSSTTWILVPPDEPGMGNIQDLRSGASGQTSTKRPYADL